MDYEKAYKASLKTAAQWIKDGCTDKEKICLECVFPELRESEDENLKNKSGYYRAGKFWKASTLWNAVKDKTPQRVPNRYILQECTWNIGTLQRFADEIKNVQEVSLDYPIILDINGNILDGAHRVVKAYLEGKDIDIVYLGDDEWPEPDYDEEKAVKESEDERIRKWLLECVENLSDGNFIEVSRQDVLFYLEKQKEQKPKRERNKPKESWLEKSKYELAHEEELLTKRQKELSEIRALKDKEQKPAQTSEEKEYIRTLKSLISDFIRDKQPEDVIYYQRVYDWLEGRHIEQKPNIELIQRSWYMEGYNDRNFGKEPKWIIKTGEGGPRHELNPRYGQPLAKEQKSVEWSEEDERLIKTTIAFLKDFADTGWENAVECIDWLKALPMRCPKSSDNGKPSEEQEPEYYQHFDPDC